MGALMMGYECDGYGMEWVRHGNAFFLSFISLA